MRVDQLPGLIPVFQLGTTAMPHYIPDEAYNRLIDALLNLEPDPFTGRVEPDGIKIALGEIGDVWPSAIRADVALSTGIVRLVHSSSAPQPDRI